MKKKILLLAIAVMLCSFGFSQNEKNSIKIYIGNMLCEENGTLEMTADQLLNVGKLTIIVGNKDTISKMSYTMQMTKGNDLTAKMNATNSLFTSEMITNLRNSNVENKAKKVWIENITIDYKGETRKLPMFTIIIINKNNTESD